MVDNPTLSFAEKIWSVAQQQGLILMGSEIEPHPELPHSYPTIMAWLSSAQDAFSEKSDFWAMNKHLQTQYSVLPAGYFRRQPEQLFQGLEVHKKFLSSGTSGAQRAVAMFSKQGLELYRGGALASFRSVLRHYWDDTSAVGFSLIAKASAVPNSSLAAMIGWFAEAGDITYTSAEKFKADVQPYKERLYVWGTVANYLRLCKCYDSIPLPADSLVFETGGIKALDARLNLEELHQRLAKFFQLKQTQIVSEYGMCEIASQAYRFGGVEEFRFPVWVKAFVRGELRPLTHLVQSTGLGSLVLYDCLRSDYPYLLCTEDKVLLKDGRFKLLGRTNNAPLRGCSLDYEVEFMQTTAKPHTLKERGMGVELREKPLFQQNDEHHGPGGGCRGVASPLRQKSQRQQAQRLLTLRPALLEFLRTQAEALLFKELGNVKLAALACLDIIASLPDDWQQALASSLPEPELRRWLYILPSSHSLVGIYPLCFGYCLGLSMTVKLTEQCRLPLAEAIITLLNALSPATQIKTTRSRTPIAEVDAVLCYGSSATLANLRRAYPTLPLAGYGTHDTVIVSTTAELNSLCTEISKDVCALRQRGCFAAKVLFCVGTSVDTATIVALQASLSAYDLPALPDLERHRYENIGAKFVAPASFQCALLTLNNTTDYEQLLPRTGSVLPLVQVKDEKLLASFLQQQQTIKTIACSQWFESRFEGGIAGKKQVKIGQANAQVWDGAHEGRALFATGEAP